MNRITNPPVALSIAGSDNSAGAGIQADLKTFGALGVYGLTAITCVVAEVPGKVSALQPIDPAIVREQIRLCFQSFPVGAVKTGMLYSRAIIEAVCEELVLASSLCDIGERLELAGGSPSNRSTNSPTAHSAVATTTALVVDPVMVATSGDALLDASALEAYTQRLFKLATLITPNLDEVATLLGRRVYDPSVPDDLSPIQEAGAELSERFGTAFLLKGGHLRGDAIDFLFANGRVSEFTAPRVPDVKTHGTGCTYSAGIAAGLAKGYSLELSVGEAKEFVTRAIGNSLRWTDGSDALNHTGLRASSAAPEHP